MRKKIAKSNFYDRSPRMQSQDEVTPYRFRYFTLRTKLKIWTGRQTIEILTFLKYGHSPGNLTFAWSIICQDVFPPGEILSFALLWVTEKCPLVTHFRPNALVQITADMPLLKHPRLHQ